MPPTNLYLLALLFAFLVVATLEHLYIKLGNITWEEYPAPPIISPSYYGELMRRSPLLDDFYFRRPSFIAAHPATLAKIEYEIGKDRIHQPADYNPRNLLGFDVIASTHIPEGEVIISDPMREHIEEQMQKWQDDLDKLIMGDAARDTSTEE